MLVRRPFDDDRSAAEEKTLDHREPKRRVYRIRSPPVSRVTACRSQVRRDLAGTVGVNVNLAHAIETIRVDQEGRVASVSGMPATSRTSGSWSGSSP